MEAYGDHHHHHHQHNTSSGNSCQMMVMMCSNSNNNNNHNFNDQQQQPPQQQQLHNVLPLPFPTMANPTYDHHHHHQQQEIGNSKLNNHGSSIFPHNNNISGFCFVENNDDSNNNNDNSLANYNASLRAKIMAHPHYHRLLSAYLNCQKVGAPPEVVAKLEEVFAAAATTTTMGAGSGTSCIGQDPALDQFMEAYCEMLTKYEQELSKPFKEALLFLQRVESEFNALCLSSPICERGDGPSSEVVVNSDAIDPQAEDQELKGQLLRRYSGYLGSLKQEFMKKRKKGKLPKEARDKLLEWWSRHYKWPYPSESQKIALAESTGLDQKQINNWFINQRKRHWKPSEDMQFVVMDAAHPHHYYIDTVLGNPFPMDVSPTLL